MQEDQRGDRRTDARPEQNPTPATVARILRELREPVVIVRTGFETWELPA